MLTRFGGDEFVVFCEDVEATEVDQLVARVAAQFVEPFELSRLTIGVHASIGVALPGSAGESARELLRGRRGDV